MPTYRLNDREHATVLAALRSWQSQHSAVYAEYDDIATNGGKVEPLTVDEIDRLCERLNMGEIQEGATGEEIDLAREMYGSEDIQVDEGAAVLRGDDGSWVQGWLLVPTPEGLEE